jgi:hypothetical protein
MKALLFIVAIPCMLSACGTKTSESTTGTADSVAVDSVLADTPAPSLLAFSPMTGYSVKNTVSLSDSVTFLFLASQEDLDKQFAADPAVAKPDFVINYNVAVICLPSRKATTIVVDKVELGDAINVYLTISRGAQQPMASKAAQLFAIERRDGYGSIRFYVNGKESGGIMLP